MLVGCLLSCTLRVKALKKKNISTTHGLNNKKFLTKFMPRRGPFYFHIRARVIGMKKVDVD